MTAPDPELTDLIAAHLVETVTPDGDCGVFILDCTCGAEVRFTQADLNAAPVDSTAGALHYMLREHVAVVLEQHTNGRIAELEAERDQAIAHDRQPYPTAWAYEQACAALEKHRERAEKAEATIARVEKLAHDMRGWCSPHGISVTYSDRILAALEGES